MLDKKEMVRNLGRQMREHKISYYALSMHSGLPKSTIMRVITRATKEPTLDTLMAMQAGVEKWKEAQND